MELVKPVKWKYPANYKIVVIGDVHGDFNVVLHSLKKAKLINNKNKWIGGKTFVVQIGDILDRGGRGDSVDTDNPYVEVDIIRYLINLKKQALQVGGNVFFLIGNHELMNLEGDFSYTSPNTTNGMGGIYKRTKLLKPGGALSKLIGIYGIAVLQIGKWVFSHAGLLPHSLAAITKGATKLKDIEASIGRFNTLVKHLFIGNINLNQLSPVEYSLIFGVYSPFWNRIYMHNKKKCEFLYDTLNYLHIHKNGGMVVGHTVHNTIK